MSDQGIPQAAVEAAAKARQDRNFKEGFTVWDWTACVEAEKTEALLGTMRADLEAAAGPIRKEVLREVEEAIFSDGKIEGDLSFLDILMGGEHGQEEVDALREAWAPLLASLSEDGDACERCGGRGFNFGTETEGMVRCEVCNGTGKKPPDCTEPVAEEEGEWFCKGCVHMAVGRICDGCGYAFDWPQPSPDSGEGSR